MTAPPAADAHRDGHRYGASPAVEPTGVDGGASASSWWPALMVLAVLVLLPVGRAAEAPLAIGALAGIVLLARGRLAVEPSVVRLAVGVFACYWMPALLSAFAAVEPQRSWATVATTLRFLPFVLFAAWALPRLAHWRAVTWSIAAVVTLWILDAYVQMATGYSLGGPAEAERLSGIFGAGNLKLGPTLAVLSPFVLLAARERFGRAGLAVAFALTIAPILLSGSRAAWLMYGLVCIAVAWHETRRKAWFALALGLALAAIAGVGALALRDSSGFGKRIERSMLALRGTSSAIDEASAGRVRIWRTATAMIVSHPLVGVGVRGFRYAYPRYAAAGDLFVDTSSDTGASHAHQIVLEVLSETGIVGLLSWMGGIAIAIRAWRRAGLAARRRALAPALALLVMCFPLNTHLAFYSAWWGLLFWWLIALYCAALCRPSFPDAQRHSDR